ncbi:MAG: DUF5666 domain-containing protein [Vulcanimicrobiaceae bacterium]|jgi:hypothetical protein
MKLRTLTLTLLTAFALTTAFAVSPQAATAQSAYGRANGTIATRDGSSFTMDNGVTVFMHTGTVINPTGTDLQPGMNIAIVGHYNGDGTMSADTINVGAPVNYYPAPSYHNGWYDRDGNWHEGRAANGWYDSNGNWHAYSNGWYDSNGNWHPGS